MTSPMSLPEAKLDAALAEADLRVLLMVVYHLTGDDHWLSEPFLPQRDVNLIADEDAGLSPEAQAELRATAKALLSAGTTHPAINDPAERMPDLMQTCLGERVPAEYATMMREEMGFADRRIKWSGPSMADRAKHPVIIIGAGASGLTVGYNLRELGIPFVILEKNDEVGGTWLENRYPGCAVDTPNHAYSFSFGSREPWERYFSKRDALLRYMISRSQEFGLREFIRFGTAVTRCDWDEGSACWRVQCTGPDGAQTLTGMALISAIGPLSLPSKAPIPGADNFNGPLFHSAEWPEDLDVTGKRVAVIGTGASSMQIVPTIVDRVASLTVYQRTPQWVRHIPRFQDQMTEGQCWLLENVPFYAEWFRFTMLWRYGDGLLRTLKRDPDWPHPERAMNRMNDRHREQMAAHIEQELDGRPDLLAKCMPIYPPYAKRILLDNGWYQALCKPNCELVTDHIERITAGGVQTKDGTDRSADIIVLATGFKVFQNAARLNVTGRNERRLEQDWADDDPKAHLGITAPGFPNMFFMQGPNTVLAHGGSAIFTSECQARYAVGAIVRMLEDGIAALDVRQDVHDDYMARVDAEHRELVWNHPGMKPWYRNAKGRVAAAIPWRLVDYWTMTREPDLDEYHLTRETGT
ncbi:MAG: flavin-containing monooxygenase [Paracoccaceae bacterium]